MRAGFLFLILQSLLLCNAAQAEAGLVETQKVGTVAGLLQTGGRGEGPPPPDEDGDGDLQPAPVPAEAAYSPNDLQPPGLRSQIPFRTGRTGHTIRAPPLLA